MSKAKLTIKAVEMPKYQSAFDLAEIKILQVQNVGEFNKVEISYKTEQQILNAGLFVNTVIVKPVIESEVKTKTKTKTKN